MRPGACSAEGVVELPPDGLGLPVAAVRRGSAVARSTIPSTGRSRAVVPPGLVLREQPGADPVIWSAADATGVQDRLGVLEPGAIVEPPPHGARTTKPPSVPSSRTRNIASRATRTLQQVRPVLAGRGGKARPSQAGRPPRMAGSAGRPARRLAPAPRGCGTRSGPRNRSSRRAAGPRRWPPTAASDSRPTRRLDRCLGERHPDALPPPRRLDPDRADPADAAVDAQDARPDDPAVRLGDERVRLRVASREVEIDRRSPHSHGEGGGDRFDVGRRHRADAVQSHDPIVSSGSKGRCYRAPRRTRSEGEGDVWTRMIDLWKAWRPRTGRRWSGLACG